jgi:hypothetical protein
MNTESVSEKLIRFALDSSGMPVEPTVLQNCGYCAIKAAENAIAKKTESEAYS